ncbi:MAG: hypothetical protein K0R14_167 [Burkholderiales bacterium]|jgi:hypothetical protein|nr:hypothetical protein [Burkholderiales bacterium]
MKNPVSSFSYDGLIRLKKFHIAWRLLCMDNSPLILSFLYRTFILPNLRVISYPQLVTKLDDYLFLIRNAYGEDLYPRRAKEYIDDWAGDDNGFFRIYYVHNTDEPEVDITPAIEKVFEWINSLEQRTFIGTESRLLYLFQLIRDMVSNTEQDATMRLAELEQQKANIELEIAKVKSGSLAIYDSRQIKERFIQIEDTAQSLISDFRQVENNFRTLDREMRERIATSDKNKGGLLDDVFSEQDAIKDSDQGKSFKGFWEYLMSPERQDELKSMLDKIFLLPEIEKKNFLQNIDVDLLDVGERVYQSYNLIAEQLRKYLDSQSYLEHKRIAELIKFIERNAIENKDNELAQKLYMEINDTVPMLESTMSRPLFTPPRSHVIQDNLLIQGQANSSLELLYQQYGIDEDELYARIRKLLQLEPQISLKQVITKYPVQHGLAEIITYLHLATKKCKAVIDNELKVDLPWVTDRSVKKQLTLPNIIFIR